MKKTMIYLFASIALMFWAATASATTVDLLSLFDTNGDGRAQFGDGFTSKTGLDYDEQEAVTEYFNLPTAPAATGTFSLTLTFDNVQTGAYFNLNGMDYAPLSSYSGTRTYTGDMSSLQELRNSLTFYVFPLSSSNLDDYSLSQLTLEYEDEVTTGAPVPEPGTMLLVGFGLIGLAGFSRKHQGKK